MKRIIVSTTCFLLILTLCFSETSLISSRVNPLINLLTEASVASTNEEYQKSEDLMNQAVRLWSKNIKLLGIILRHNELDTIDELFVRSAEYAKNGDNPSFQVEYRELTHRLNNLINKEQLTLKNIF